MPPELPERWRPIRRLGTGGQGEVWLADDLTLGQRVALKVIPRGQDDEAAERTRREVRAGRQLGHRHLIRVFDLVDSPHHFIVVMEWLAGGSVKDRLMAGALSVADVVAVAEDTLAALAHLHRHGVVHRDIKPSNLLFGADGRLKVADLGLVRDLSKAADLTRTGFTVGTPSYMSPEQLRGALPAPPTDLYALGITLYELLTGQRPFVGPSEFEIADAHLHRTVTSLRSIRPDCPRWLAAFVHRMLEKRPGDRWPDAASALAALSRRRVGNRRWRRRALWLAIGATALAGLVASLWSLAGLQRPPMAALRTIDRSTVAAVAPDGSELWRRQFDGAITWPSIADVTGDATPELVVGVDQDHASAGMLGCSLRVLSATGEEIARVDPGTESLVASYSDLSRRYLVGAYTAADLDHDGRPELLWKSQHREWYPSAVGVWWGHDNGRNQTLLVNSGRLDQIAVADLDQDGLDEVIVTGVNNPLGYQSVVAILSTAEVTARSPDFINAKKQPSAFLGFVTLGPEDAAVSIESASIRGLVLRSGSALWTLDRWGHSVGSNSETIRQEGLRFWSDLHDLCRSLPLEADGREGLIAGFLASNSQALGERGAWLAADLMISRALAAAGDHTLAVAELQRATAQHPGTRDLWLRLGEQRLILGQRTLGRAALLRSLQGDAPGRLPFDGVLILTLDAALHDDESAWDEALRLWDGTVESWQRRHPEVLAPLRPFFDGRWRDAAFDDHTADVSLKATAVMAAWSGLERGNAPSDVADLARQLALDPEIADPARLLEAAAHLRGGDTRAARAITRETLDRLRISGATSYEAFVWLPVAEWLMGAILSADGEIEAAAPHLQRSVDLAPEAWPGRRAAAALSSP